MKGGVVLVAVDVLDGGDVECDHEPAERRQ